MDPGQGVSCWAKHCTDPAPDRHTVGAAKISPAGDSGSRFPPLVLSANFSEVPKYHTLSMKIPHAKSQLLRDVQKNAQLGAMAWWKSDTVATCPEEKANDSRIGRKMLRLVPRLG